MQIQQARSPYSVSLWMPVRSATVAALGGLALGAWCRWAIESRPSTSVQGVLAELGAPWIAVAFAVGALATGHHDHSRQSPRSVSVAVAIAAVSGAICLMLATFVYYGPARTGRVSVSGSMSETAAWMMGSLVVGIVFGACGAIWRIAPRSQFGWIASMSLGAAIASEAAFRLRIGADGDDLSTTTLFVVLIAVGVATPMLLLRPSWRGLVAAAIVAAVVLPGSLVAESFNDKVVDTSRTLQSFADRPDSTGIAG